MLNQGQEIPTPGQPIEEITTAQERVENVQTQSHPTSDVIPQIIVSTKNYGTNVDPKDFELRSIKDGSESTDEEQDANTPLARIINYHLDLEKRVRSCNPAVANLLNLMLSLGFTVGSVIPYLLNGGPPADCTIEWWNDTDAKCNKYLAAKLTVAGTVINLATGWNTITPFFDKFFAKLEELICCGSTNIPKELKDLYEAKSCGTKSAEFMGMVLLSVVGVLSAIPNGLSVSRDPNQPDKWYNSMWFYASSVTITTATNGVMNTFPLLLIINNVSDWGWVKKLYQCCLDCRKNDIKRLENTQSLITNEWVRRVECVKDELHDESIEAGALKRWGSKRLLLPFWFSEGRWWTLPFRFRAGYPMSMPDEHSDVINILKDPDRQESHYEPFLSLMRQKNAEGLFLAKTSKCYSLCKPLDIFLQAFSALGGASLGVLGLFPYNVETWADMGKFTCWANNQFNNQTYSNYPCSTLNVNGTSTFGDIIFSENIPSLMDTMVNNSTGWEVFKYPEYYLPKIGLTSVPTIFFGAMTLYFAGGAGLDFYKGIKSMLAETVKAVTHCKLPRYLPRSLEYAPIKNTALVVFGAWLASNSWATVKYLLNVNRNETIFLVAPWLYQAVKVAVYAGPALFNSKNWSEVFENKANQRILNAILACVGYIPERTTRNCYPVDPDHTGRVFDTVSAYEEVQSASKLILRDGLIDSFNKMSHEDRLACTGIDTEDKFELMAAKLKGIKIVLDENKEQHPLLEDKLKEPENDADELSLGEDEEETKGVYADKKKDYQDSCWGNWCGLFRTKPKKDFGLLVETKNVANDENTHSLGSGSGL